MKKYSRIIFAVIFAALLQATGAKEITYQIVEFNKSTGEFTLSPSGEKPVGSYAIFENEFGATTGNRYNQIPRNKTASLYLMGWEGCTVEKVTLNMCSNKASGEMALEVQAGDRELYTMHAMAFDQWYGMWVNKDLGIYVDVWREMTEYTPVEESEVLRIDVKGGTSEGSVYLNSVTIEYDANGVDTESPLGWKFSKLEAKSTFAAGDVVMMYRNGDAAGDIDGMETSHYLDAIGVASTANVSDPFIELFTIGDDGEGHYTLTNEHGQKLGAVSAQNLAWDEGNTSWDIKLGYDGATIASTNSKCGTMRYNAPSGSYPRFWNYTSTSLQLPYLYRRGEQNQPVAATSINLSFAEREVDLAVQDTVVIKRAVLPAVATDKRLKWSSDNAEVAEVSDGIVRLMGEEGDVTIEVQSVDGGAEASCVLHVTNSESGVSSVKVTAEKEYYYGIDGCEYGYEYGALPAGLYITSHGKKVVKRK